MGTMLDMALAHGDTVRYLSRVLLDGTDEAGALFDRLVDATEELLTGGEHEGWVRSTSDARMRAALLTTRDLGVLAPADHVSRATGNSVFERAGMRRWSHVVLELYAHGLLTDDAPLHPVDAAALRSPTDRTTHETTGDAEDGQ